MKRKKSKLQVVALGAVASALITGAGVEPANNNTNIAPTGISASTDFNVNNELRNLGVELSASINIDVLKNDLLIMRLNNCILTQMNSNDKDGKIKEIIEYLVKLVESKFKIISVTCKYNNNGTHTITTKYLNKMTGKEETRSLTKECTYPKNSNKCEVCYHVKRHASSNSSSSNNNSHTHNYIKIEEVVISNANGTHDIISTYECPSDSKTKTETKTENCSLDNWVIDETGTNMTATCDSCNYTETKEIPAHVHSNPPTDLKYEVLEGNGDNTHTLKGTYTCETCGEELEKTKVEPCVNVTTGYEIFSEYNSYNYHDRVDECTICNTESKVREECTKIGEMKCIDINGTIYDYYNCEFCNGYVDRFEHKNHTFGEWDINPDYHIRYCICVDEREKGEHVYSLSPDPDDPNFNIATCDICAYSKKTLNHEHAKNEMGLMELLNSPFYDELISKSQIKNPNPSPDDYCSRYDLKCKTCGMEYSITYAHKFVNGVCTRTGYCGGIVDPDYISDDISYEEEFHNEVDYTDYESESNTNETHKSLKLVQNS